MNNAAPVFAQIGSAGSRSVLVIGNGNYSDLGNLKNPVNDATDMAAALNKLGFATELLVDADLVAMEDAVTLRAAGRDECATRADIAVRKLLIIFEESSPS